MTSPLTAGKLKQWLEDVPDDNEVLIESVAPINAGQYLTIEEAWRSRNTNSYYITVKPEAL